MNRKKIISFNILPSVRLLFLNFLNSDNNSFSIFNIIYLNKLWLELWSFFYEIVIIFVFVVYNIILRGVYIWFPILLKLPLFDKLLFSLCSWPFFPFSRICLSVHYYSFSFTDCSMITWSYLSCCHLGDSYCHCLTFCWHNHNLFANVDVTVKSKNSGNH